jgi:L-asparaginase II
MLAYVHMKNQTGETVPEGLDYIDFSHPIQKEILQTFAEMCGLAVEQVHMGVDGCSAPNFAIPLYNAGLGFARLSDPETGEVQPEARRKACHTIVQAMMSHPDMVGGPGRFDTRLMQMTGGRIVSKGGAEAFQGIGLLPGAIEPGSPALGIAMKISDGDARNQALHAVALEVLQQLGALNAEQMDALHEFGPSSARYNWRKIEVGQAYPTFELNWA